MSRNNVRHKVTVNENGFTVTVDGEYIVLNRFSNEKELNFTFEKKDIGSLYAMMKEARKQYELADEALEMLEDLE